jgi:small subunit ribosomal protein S5
MLNSDKNKGKSRSFSKNRKNSKDRKEKDEFDSKILDIARVARVVKGGRRFSFRTTVIIGDRKGKVGIGIGKGADVASGMDKATAKAKKNLIKVNIKNDTIPYEISEKYGAAKVFLKPAKKGRGVSAGGAVRTVVELAGIENVSAKILGSANKINNANATLKALARLKAKTQNLKVKTAI